MSVRSGGRMQWSSPRRNGWKRREEEIPKERVFPGTQARQDNTVEGGLKRRTKQMTNTCHILYCMEISEQLSE